MAQEAVVDFGIVYIFVNEAMPGYIKIGLTRKESVESRLKQLDNTSVPLPFTCYYYGAVLDCAKLERTLHFVFGQWRASKTREFFKADPDLARAIIDLVKVDSLPFSVVEAPDLKVAMDPDLVTNSAVEKDDREHIQEIKKLRAKTRTLAALGVHPGTTLRFAKDQSEKCVVHDERRVLFRSEVVSLSSAALTLIREMGFSWPSVNGMEYWLLDGEKLSNRSLEDSLTAQIDPE